MGGLIGVTALALLASLPAFAQDSQFDAHGMRFAPGLGRQSDLVTTWRPDVGAAGSFGGTLLFDYADATLVQVTETADGLVEEPLMQNLVGGTGLFRAALHDRIGIGVEIPLSISSQRLGEAQGVSLRDIRLSVPVELLDTQSFDLGVVPYADLPTGPGDRLLGNGFGAGGVLAAAVNSGRFDITGNLGGVVHPGADLLNIAGTPELIAAAGVSAQVLDTFSLAAELDAGARGQRDGPTGFDVPLEAIASGRVLVPGGPQFLAGVGTNLTPGAGTANLRAFLAVSYALDRGRDFDADGVVDREDQCVSDPETMNGWNDTDGCPDTLTTLVVRALDPDGEPIEGLEIRDGTTALGTTDADGRLALAERMPGTTLSLIAEVPEGRRFRELEAATLTLVEGEMETDLAFSWRPGSFRVVVVDEDGNPVDAELTFRGASAVDAVSIGEDGTAVLGLENGSWSLVIENEDYGLASQEIAFTAANAAEFQTVTFTLRAREVATTREEVVVLNAVNFKLDSDELEESSINLLNEVAANLLKHEQLKKVEVQGHTSSDGEEDYNLDLSQRRMESVVRYLTSKGVAQTRLDPIGYGEACPLVSNATEDGRSENRRVQFIVLDPPPEEGGIPCHDGNPARRVDTTTLQVEE